MFLLLLLLLLYSDGVSATFRQRRCLLSPIAIFGLMREKKKNAFAGWANAFHIDTLKKKKKFDKAKQTLRAIVVAMKLFATFWQRCHSGCQSKSHPRRVPMYSEYMSSTQRWILIRKKKIDFIRKCLPYTYNRQFELCIWLDLKWNRLFGSTSASSTMKSCFSHSHDSQDVTPSYQPCAQRFFMILISEESRPNDTKTTAIPCRILKASNCLLWNAEPEALNAAPSLPQRWVLKSVPIFFLRYFPRLIELRSHKWWKTQWEILLSMNTEIGIATGCLNSSQTDCKQSTSEFVKNMFSLPLTSQSSPVFVPSLLQSFSTGWQTCWCCVCLSISNRSTDRSVRAHKHKNYE